MQDLWMREPSAVFVVRERGGLVLVGKDGAARRFEDASADLVEAALAFWAAPHTEAELLEHVRVRAGVCEPELVQAVTACLRDAGAIRKVAAAPSRPQPAARADGPRARILLGVSGAIGATEVPALVRLLQARRFEVKVVLTRAARRFVTRESLEAITHDAVLIGFWPPDRTGPAPHVRLAAWADVMVLYPATAATIAKVAHGACSDVLSATATAARGPVLVVPAMNEAMLRAPAVARNLEQLRADGRFVAEAGPGVEVAWAPGARGVSSGGALRPEQVVIAVEHLARDVAKARRAPGASPADWDRRYDRHAAELPWFTEALDADLAEELGAMVGTGRVLLDVGTGPGTTAIFAARRGFHVVATDVSRAALACARARAEGLPIAWVEDDVLTSRLHARFDVVVDRGCLHCLPRAAWPSYARAMKERVAPGGTLLLKVHAPAEGDRHGTEPASEADLADLFAGAFTITKVQSTVFDGRTAPPPRALFAVLVRNATKRVTASAPSPSASPQ
jgi:SAM-dependent methyltransferase/3-polyprenyl-4-hydroxybenzoate decarboxylase